MKSMCWENNKSSYKIAKVTVLLPSKEVFQDYVLCYDFLCSTRDLEHVHDNSDSSSHGEQENDFKRGKKNSDYDFVFVDLIPSPDERTCLPSAFTANSCKCFQDTLHERSIPKIMKLGMDMQVFPFIVEELKKSKIYRSYVLSKLFHMHCKTRKPCNSSASKEPCSICGSNVQRTHVTINLVWPQQYQLDVFGSKKMQLLVNERCELENSLAWLSTLGGAFSSLGDTYLSCAEKAGMISMKQLCIALKIGDPLTICRCKIYFTISLLQRGQYRKVKKMIVKLYNFATEDEGRKDSRLQKMCLSVWNRLKYESSLKTNSYNTNAFKKY